MVSKAQIFSSVLSESRILIIGLACSCLVETNLNTSFEKNKSDALFFCFQRTIGGHLGQNRLKMYFFNSCTVYVNQLHFSHYRSIDYFSSLFTGLKTLRQNESSQLEKKNNMI